MPRHSRVFRRFLISYIVILIIPSIAGYMSYRTSITVTKQLSIENSVTQLQKSEELLERRMAEVEGFTRQLAINPDLSFLMNQKASGVSSNVYGIWKMMRVIFSYGQTNDFLQNFYIYLTNYNIVLTPGSAYFRPEHYYESYYYADMSVDKWKKDVLLQAHHSEILPLQTFIDKDKPTSVVTYMQSLPLDSFGNPSPAIAVVLIDGDTIASLLTGITDRYGGWVHVSDDKGSTIASHGITEADIRRLASDSRFDPGKISQYYNDDLVITIRSAKNGWVYQAGIPKEVLFENANKIRSMASLLTGLALVVGLAVGLALAYRNSAPIHRLLAVVKEQFGADGQQSRNEYDFLHGNIADMIVSNKRLESELRRQLPLLRDAFLKRLIAGELRSKEEIAAAAAQAYTGIAESSGYVGLLQINGYAGMDSVEILQELSAARLVLKQALVDRAGPVLTTDQGSDKVVVLFPSKDGETGEAVGGNDVAQTLGNLCQFLSSEYRMSVTAALSDFFPSVMDVSQSFEQAKQALEYALHANRTGVVRFEEIRVESATFYYPLEMEQRLVGTIRAGEAGEAQRIVEAVIAQNTQQRELSIEMKHQLVGELKGTFLKLLDHKAFQDFELFESVKNRIVGIRETDTVDAVRAEIDAIIEAMCGLVQTKRNDSHMRIVEQIKQFIEERYSDSELTLYRVAERVERPEKYISQLFKEVTGVNLSDYLEKVRMEHAIELLRTSGQTVDEIAARVGYNSSHSFRRAFKRVTGVSPSSYRLSLSRD